MSQSFINYQSSKPQLGFVSEKLWTTPKLFVPQLYTQNFTLKNQPPPEENQVLTSDSNGKATWQDSTSSSLFTYIQPLNMSVAQSVSEITCDVIQTRSSLRFVGSGNMENFPGQSDFEIDLTNLTNNLPEYLTEFQFNSNYEMPVGHVHYVVSDGNTTTTGTVPLKTKYPSLSNYALTFNLGINSSLTQGNFLFVFDLMLDLQL
jgi:hypothetical protein